MNNTGADDAYHVTIHTNLDVLEDDLYVETEEWSFEVCRRLPTSAEEDFSWRDKIQYLLSINSDQYETGFREISQALYSYSREAGHTDSIDVRVLVWLSFEDVRSNEDDIELVDKVVEVDGEIGLSAGHATGIHVETLLPRISVVEADVFKSPFNEVDRFGIDYKIRKGSEPVDFTVYSEVEILNGSDWVTSNEFFSESDGFWFSGCELSSTVDDNSLLGELLFEWGDGSGEGEVVSFEFLSERFLDREFENVVRIRFRVEYVDAAGNQGSDAVANLCKVLFSEDTEGLPGDVVIVSEPCNLYEAS